MRLESPCLLIALALGAACQTVVEPAAAPVRDDVAADRSWTDAFEPEAVLLAEDVWIEGPPGLLHHVVIGQNPEDYDHSVSTTSEGLLQEARIKPALAGMAATTWTPLRAQLDNLIIASSHRLRVLERFEPADVIVRARGRVVWKRVDGTDEKRGDRLELVGECD